MKKEERLQHLCGDIDEALIEEAARPPRRTVVRIWLPRIATAAAAVALTAGIVVAGPWTPNPPIDPTVPVESDPVSDTTDTTGESGSPEDTNDGDVSDTTIDTEAATTTTDNTRQTTAQNNTTTTDNAHTTPDREDSTTAATNYATTTQNDAAYVKRWDERSIVEKFPGFKWNTTVFEYHVNDKSMEETAVGEFITDVTATGYDVYTDTTYTQTVHLYAVHGIAPAAAVAIQYDGDRVYYPACNGDYTPATLGDLIRDLNLEQTLQVNGVYFEYRDADYNFHDTKYSGLTKDTMWQMLLSDATLPNVYDQQMGFWDTIDVSVSIPLLGISHVISVSETGYLFTNMLSTGKAFYVGEDVYTAFVDYVQNNLAVESDRVVPYTPAPTDEDTATTTSKGAQPPTVTGTTTIKLN